MKEIVIKIPDGAYNGCLKLKSNEDHGMLGFCLINAVANGIVLPKGHGELKDANEILAKTHAMQKDLESNNDRIWAINKPKYKALAYANRFIIDAPTLVEADKGDTE